MGSGGAEHQLAELCRLLAERGYQVSITTFADEEDHYVCAPGIIRKRLAPNRGKVWKMICIFFFFLRVKTDVVISFGQRESAFCLIPLLFRCKIKVICGERNFTKGRGGKIEKLLVRLLYKRADFIVSNSHSQHHNIVSLAPSLAYKTRTIINYLNTDYYSPAEASVHNNPLRIGVFCRYAPQKNCERFVKAVAMARSKGCEFVVDWYGNQSSKSGAPNDYYLRIQSLVIDLGVEDCLKLNDHVKNVKDLMSQYAAICLPSLWEGFANTIAEGICCGRPILASDVSDNGIMVKNGVNGFLFDPTDEESICSALKQFIELPVVEREKMGVASRVLAEQLFDEEKFVNQYISLMR